MPYMRQALKTALASLALSALACPAHAAERPEASLQAVYAAFTAEFEALHVPGFPPGYMEYFRDIPPLDALARQAALFEKTRAQLDAIPRKDLGADARYQYDTLRYELEFNVDRVKLEKTFREKHADAPRPQDGLFKVPDGAQWYALYVRKAASKNLSPEAAFRFGQSEVERVTREIKAIQAQMGYAGKDADFYRRLNDASFYSADPDEVPRRFLALRDVIEKNLSRQFAAVRIPPVVVKPNPNPTKDAPPGFYTKGTFFFSLFNNRFPERSRGWLFLHEGIPGHHYQTHYPTDVQPISKLFWYQAYTEGWGAYCEDLGKELGVYADPYLHLGKWEWDLVRSARVVLDVGIHFKGWSREQALAYWREHVPNQDDIAERELDRITRWPAQSISYKAGEHAFLDLKREYEQKKGRGFDVREFHSLVLKRGSLPLSVLESIVHDAMGGA